MTNPGLSGGRAMLELAERCEKATGPDHVLSGDIAYVVGTYQAPDRGSPDGWWPKHTASLDAALSLVPEGHVMAVTNCGTDNPRGPDWTKASAVVGKEEDSATEPVTAATPALALCAAALRARAADTPSVKP